MTRLGKILSRCRLVAAAITTGMALGSSGVAQTINWDGDGAQGNFSWNENWYGNNQPSWGFGNNLVFNFKNGSQTSLYYDYGDWRSIGDIIWETTWPVGVTFNGNGQGINFNQRIENRSSYTITIGSMNLSGGKNGASQIELNPVNGDLTLNGNIYNDNNLRYKVYGANQKLLTINTALGGNTGVALDIEQNSKVSITKAQTMGASAAFNIKQGELWLSVASALAGGSTINLGQADANTAKLYLNGADDSHAVTVANTSGTKVLGTISASGTQTFSGNITLNGNVLLEATQSGATVDFATGAISGNSGVTITGTGTVKLSGNNSYTGGTTVSAGTLLLGNNDRLSDSGSVTVSGGTFNLGGFSDTVAAVTISGGTISNGTLTGSSYAGQSGTVSAVLAGNGALTKSTAGTLTLSGANTYTGGTTVNAGTLLLGNNDRLSNSGNVTVSGGTFDLGGFSDTVATVTISGGTISNGTLTGSSYDGQSGTVSAVLAGSGVALNKTTSGILTLSGANTYSGGLTLSAGTINLNNAAAAGTGTFTIGGGTIDNTTAGSITLNNNQNWNGDFTFTGTQALNLGTGGVTLGSTRQVTVTAGNLTVGGIISGNFGLTKAGAGTLILSGASTYTGATTVSAGVLNIQNATATGTTANGISVTSGAALQIQGGIEVGAESLTLNGSGVSNTGALRNISSNNTFGGAVTLGSASTIASDSGTLILSGAIGHGGNRLTVLGNSGVTISGNMSGTGASDILKQGSGILTLSGDNSGLNPSGVTSIYIDQGTVYVNNNNAGGAKAIELGSGVSGSGTAALYAIGGRSIANAITIQSENTTALTIGSDSTSDDNTFTGNVTIEKTANFNAGSGRTVTFTNGVLSGAGGVTKTGTGTLSLLGANTFSGNVIISAGTLSITNANSLGRGDFNFGNGNTLTTLLVNSNTTITNTFRVYNAASNAVINVAATTTNTISGKLTQDGNDAKTKFGKDGDGTLILNNSTSDFKGQLQLGRGTVILGHNNALGSNTSVNDRGVDLGLNVGDTVTSTDVALLASGGVTVGQSIYVAPNNSSAKRTIGLSGSGTATFNNEIRLDQNTTVTVDAGSATSDTVNIGGAITQNAGTASGIIKQGAGTLALSGANTYSGTTTINAGTLRLARTGGNSVTGSTIAVNNGGTLLLGAANQILDTTGITLAAGGTINTGGNADAVGKLTVTGNSTIQGLTTATGSSAFTFSDVDLGQYTTASGPTLNIVNSSGGFYGVGTVFQFSGVAASSWTGFNTATLNNSTTLNNFEQKIQFGNGNYGALNFGSGVTGTTLTVTAIPDARVYSAAAFLLVLIGVTEYRRRKRAQRAV